MNSVIRNFFSSKSVCSACIQLRHVSRLLSSQADGASPRVCIIGSGPAGFYTAQALLKGDKSLKVDIYDRLPVPFGLVRYGVAPDHPDVKNVINQFTALAEGGRCSFLGGVNIGTDVGVEELMNAYSAVVLSYGSDGDRTLGIPGENQPGFYSARAFVGWYNGLPENTDLNPLLDTDTAVVIGHGNVAIDVARILLTPLEILQKTDITEHAIDTLSRSRVKRVHVVGRRGPLHVSFTIKELREMLKLPGCKSCLYPQHFEGLQAIIPDLPRPKKRITELMIKTANGSPSGPEGERQAAATREWHLNFLMSPKEVLSSAEEESGRVTGVRFNINRLENIDGTKTVVTTEETETIPCGLVLRSIGYKNVPKDDFVPFDHKEGVIKNSLGRVKGVKGLYCSGWVKRGPKGTIVSSLNDSMETAKSMLDDINSGALEVTKSDGQDEILSLLSDRGVRPVTFLDWTRIDAVEKARGELVGKPREKMTNIDEMMDHAFKDGGIKGQ